MRHLMQRDSTSHTTGEGFVCRRLHLTSAGKGTRPCPVGSVLHAVTLRMPLCRPLQLPRRRS